MTMKTREANPWVEYPKPQVGEVRIVTKTFSFTTGKKGLITLEEGDKIIVKSKCTGDQTRFSLGWYILTQRGEEYYLWPSELHQMTRVVLDP